MSTWSRQIAPVRRRLIQSRFAQLGKKILVRGIIPISRDPLLPLFQRKMRANTHNFGCFDSCILRPAQFRVCMREFCMSIRISLITSLKGRDRLLETPQTNVRKTFMGKVKLFMTRIEAHALPCSGKCLFRISRKLHDFRQRQPRESIVGPHRDRPFAVGNAPVPLAPIRVGVSQQGIGG
jgi:hypothetical protein